MKKVISVAFFILFCQSLIYGAAIIPEDTKIILKRGACYGQCPIYMLTISVDGKVVYEGENFVKVFGRQEKTISADKLRQLLEKFSEMDFPGLVEKAASLDCGTYTTDVPSTEISIVENGKISSMIHNGKCYEDNLFKQLDILAKVIDETVEVQDWISPPEFKEIKKKE